jgi:hypothetical protein
MQQSLVVLSLSSCSTRSSARCHRRLRNEADRSFDFRHPIGSIARRTDCVLGGGLLVGIWNFACWRIPSENLHDDGRITFFTQRNRDSDARAADNVGYRLLNVLQYSLLLHLL